MRKKLSLEDKKFLIRQTRLENYMASLKLEGFKTCYDVPRSLTKEELIKKYKHKAGELDL